MTALPPWVWACVVLTAFALSFLLMVRGYQYMTFTLLYAAALCAVFGAGPRWLRLTAGILTVLGLMYLAVVEFFIVREAFTDKEPERSYIIVLGAAVHGDTPSLALLHRLQGTYDYLTRFPRSIAVVSGGQGRGENISEGECMRAWLIAEGIGPERIIAETEAVSTMENLRFSLDIIQKRGGDPKDVAILSSCYHLYRAKRMAETLGMKPAGVRGMLGYPVYTLSMFIREAFAVTYLWLFGTAE